MNAVEERMPAAWVCLTVPAVLACAVYALVLSHGFVYDDIWTLDKIPHSWSALISTFPQTRSLTYAVHFVDQTLWSRWAPGYHLTNILLHALASVLVASLALRLSRSRRVALLCGCLFALHPVHVEAVASFAFRKDILAMIFVALATEVWARGRSRARTIISVVCYALALLAKEVAAAALPALLLTLDLMRARATTLPLRRRLTMASLRVIPFAFLAAAVLLEYRGQISGHFSSRSIQAVTEFGLASYRDVLANSVAAWSTILRLLFFPVKLSADYDVTAGLHLFAPSVLAGALLLVAWIVAAVVTWRRAPLLSFSLLWVPIMYLPVSNVVPLVRVPVAERYLYVPSFGFCFGAALALDHLLRAVSVRRGLLRPAATAGVVILMSAAAYRSVLRAGDWRDSCTLWSSAIRAGYSTYRTHTNLGTALMERGNHKEGLKEYLTASQINPMVPDGQFNLGKAYAEEGQTEPAISSLRRATSLDPRHYEAHTCLARTLALRGPVADAVREYRLAIAIQPDYVPALAGLAWLLARCPDPKIRDGAEAVRLAEAACQAAGTAKPELVLTLAWAWEAAGNRDRAAELARGAEALAREESAWELAASVKEACAVLSGPRPGAQPASPVPVSSPVLEWPAAAP